MSLVPAIYFGITSYTAESLVNTAVLSKAMKYYPQLFLVGLVWITVFTLGNIFIVPGAIVFFLTLALINPIQWLEEKKSPFKVPTAPWMSFFFPLFLFGLWLVGTQIIPLLILAFHGDYPYLTVLFKMTEQLLWGFVLITTCQVWRLGMSLEAAEG